MVDPWRDLDLDLDLMSWDMGYLDFMHSACVVWMVAYLVEGFCIMHGVGRRLLYFFILVCGWFFSQESMNEDDRNDRTDESGSGSGFSDGNNPEEHRPRESVPV